MKKILAGITLAACMPAGAALAWDDGGHLVVAVAYADCGVAAPHAGCFVPSPWAGAPRIKFIGKTAMPLDTGAIGFLNQTRHTINIKSATVDIGTSCPCKNLNPWGKLHLELKPGEGAILATTEDTNFDTSDCGHSNLIPPSGAKPVIHVTFGDKTRDYVDSEQVLNVQEKSLLVLPGHNEGHGWVEVFETP